MVVRRIRQHHALRRPPDVIHDGRREVTTGGDGRPLQHRHVRRIDRAARLDERVAVLLEDEEAFTSAGALDQDPHQLGEQALELDLAGDGLRGLHDARGVEVGRLGLGGRERRRRVGHCRGRPLRASHPALCEQLGVAALEVLHLRVRAPFQVGEPGLGQEDGGDVRLPPLQPEPGAQFVRQSLVLDHARLSGVPDGSLIQVQRRRVTARDALDLRREQQRLAEKVLRAVLRQYRKRCSRLLHLLEIGRSLVLRGVSVVCGEREAVPEIERDGPDRSGETIHHPAGDFGGVQCRAILTKQVAELQLGDCVKRREERVPAVCLHVFVLVDRFVRQREGRSGLPLQRPRPVQDDFEGIGEAGGFQSLDQRDVRQVIADELCEVLGCEHRGPGFRARTIRGIEEIAALEAAPAGLARVGHAGVQRLPPEVHVRVKLLIDLGPPSGVVEALIHAQRQSAELVSRLVVPTHRSDRDRMRHIPVGRLFQIAVDQREAHHRGGDQARQHRVSHDVRRGPDVRQNIHDHPDLGVGHHREVEERGDAALAQQSLNGSDLALQRGLLLLGRVRERHAEQTQALAGARQGIGVARHVLVLDAA